MSNAKVDEALLEYVWTLLFNRSNVFVRECEGSQTQPPSSTKATHFKSASQVGPTASASGTPIAKGNASEGGSNDIDSAAHQANPPVQREGSLPTAAETLSEAEPNTDGLNRFCSNHLNTRMHADQESMWPVLTGHGPDLHRVRPLDFEILSLIAAHGVKGILQYDLVRISGQDKRSVPHRTDKLNDAAYIVKESVFVWEQHNRNRLRTSLCTLKRFAQEPEHRAEVERLNAEASKKVLTKIRKPKKPHGVQAADDLGKDDMSADEEANSSGRIDMPDSLTVPQWEFDRFFGNQIYNIVHEFGTDGATLPQIRYAFLGLECRKPVEYFVGRLVDAWQVSQPLHLRHLAIVRDTILRDRSPAFIHYTVPHFSKLVEMGKASWAAVATIAADVKVSKQISAAWDSTAQLDAFGFPELEEEDFLGRDNDSSLAECALHVSSARGAMTHNRVVPSGVDRRVSARDDDDAIPPDSGLDDTPVLPRTISVMKGVGRPRKFPLTSVPNNLASLKSKELHNLRTSWHMAAKYQRQKIVTEVERRVTLGESAASVASAVLGEIESTLDAEADQSMFKQVRAQILHQYADGPVPPPSELDLALSEVAQLKKKGSKRKGGPKAKQKPSSLPSDASRTISMTNVTQYDPSTIERQEPTRSRKRKREKDVQYRYYPSMVAHSCIGLYQDVAMERGFAFDYVPSIAAHSGLVPSLGVTVQFKRPKKAKATHDEHIRRIPEEADTAVETGLGSNKSASRVSDAVLQDVLSSRYSEQLQGLDRSHKGIFIGQMCVLRRRGREPYGLPRQKFQLAVFKLEQLKALTPASPLSENLGHDAHYVDLTTNTTVDQNVAEQPAVGGNLRPLHTSEGAAETDEPTSVAATVLGPSSARIPVSIPEAAVSDPMNGSTEEPRDSHTPRRGGENEFREDINPSLGQYQVTVSETGNNTTAAQTQAALPRLNVPWAQRDQNPHHKRSSSLGAFEADREKRDHHRHQPKSVKNRSSSAPVTSSRMERRKSKSLQQVRFINTTRSQDTAASGTFWVALKVDIVKWKAIEEARRRSQPPADVSASLDSNILTPSAPKETVRPRHDPSKDVAGKVKVGRVARTGGSTAMNRKTIVMELVHRANGICPGHLELCVPFTIEWTKRGFPGQPERSTVRTTINSLCSSGKLRQLTFAFKSSEGMMKTKTILTLPGVEPTDPRVKKLQQDMEKARNRVYLPKEWMFEEDNVPIAVEYPQSLPGKPQNPRKSDVYNRMEHHQKAFRRKEEEDAERSRREEGLTTLKNLLEADSRRLNPEKHDQGDEIAGRPGRKAVKRLGTLNRSGRYGYLGALRAPKSRPTGVMNFRLQFLSAFGDHVFQDPHRRTWQKVRPPPVSDFHKRTPRRRQTSHSQHFFPPSMSTTAMRRIYPTPHQRYSLNRDAIIYSLDTYEHQWARPPFVEIPSWRVGGSYSSPYTDVPMSATRAAGLQPKFIKRRGIFSGLIPSYMNAKQTFHAPTGTFSSAFHGLEPSILSNEISGILPKYRSQFQKHWSLGIPAIGRGSQQLDEQIDRLRYWELTTTYTESLRFNGWPFIHYYFPHSHERVKTREISMDNLQVQFINETTGKLHSKSIQLLRQGANWTDRATLVPQVYFSERRKRRRPSTPSDNSDSSEDETSQPVIKPRKRRRQLEALTVDSDIEDYRLISAVIAIRCLSGGLEKRCNWILIKKAVGTNHDGVSLRARWHQAKIKYGKLVDEAEAAFQENFPKAYMDGMLPPIDFSDAGSYPWKQLAEWLTKIIQPDTSINKDLPFDRSALIVVDDLEEEVEDDLNQYYELEAVASTRVRKAAANGRAWTIPYPEVYAQQPFNEEDLAVARTLIRANCAASQKAYNQAQARIELGKFSEQDMDRALKTLLQDKVISHRSRGGRSKTRRSYGLHEGSLSQLQKPIPATTFERALSFKQYLDHQLQQYGSITWSKHAQDGDMMVLMNLLAKKRVSLRTADVPLNKWGHTGEGYETRQMDKTKLFCNAVVSPTSTYVVGNPLLPLPPIPSFHLDESDGRRRRIPLWFDIHGNLLRHLWSRAVAAVMCIITTRPGIGFDDVSSFVLPMVERWELEWVLEWMVQANSVEEYVSSGCKRYRTREWWWTILDDRKSADDEVRGIEDGTWPSLSKGTEEDGGRA